MCWKCPKIDELLWPTSVFHFQTRFQRSLYSFILCIFSWNKKYYSYNYCYIIILSRYLQRSTRSPNPSTSQTAQSTRTILDSKPSHGTSVREGGSVKPSIFRYSGTRRPRTRTTLPHRTTTVKRRKLWSRIMFIWTRWDLEWDVVAPRWPSKRATSMKQGMMSYRMKS